MNKPDMKAAFEKAFITANPPSSYKQLRLTCKHCDIVTVRIVSKEVRGIEWKCEHCKGWN